MIAWIQSLDVSLFRFINQTMQNSVFDVLMPFFSNTPFFGPGILAIIILLIWKGGLRGRICVVALIVGLCFTDGAVCNTLKHEIGRLRPFNVIEATHVPPSIGRTASGSMPSSHAANWFAATLIAFIYYRRSIRFMLPLALIVSFSRIYNGVHYPTDVLAGMLLGAGSGIAVVFVFDALWQWIGPRWFGGWHTQVPSLLNPVRQTAAAKAKDSDWIHLGYLFIAVLFLARLGYLAAGVIGLSEDEAYQWLWSKHPDISYYSKPPLIAYAQYLGTHLWGDTVFGVRFFSPVIAAILSFVLLRFMAREFSAKAAVLLLLIVSVTTLMALGSTLMTVDPLSVLFWVGAMVVGWRAAQPQGTTREWLWVGLWMGLGFLSKYTNLFQWLCWALFFALWPPARKHLRRPGPCLALLVNVLCSAPVLVWNFQHDWITVKHVASDGELNQTWHFSARIFRFLGEFLGSEFGLLNPVFFVGMIWAAAAFWRSRKAGVSGTNRADLYPLQLYLFCMGAPVFIFYLLFSLHSRVLPNWIAPSVLPLFCLMVIYFGQRWGAWGRSLKPWLVGGVGLGLLTVVLTHDTNLVEKLVHRTLPPKFDVLHRVRAWDDLAAVVGKARAKLEAEGRPAFVIGDHYGFTSQITFYLPEAKARAQAGSEALVYYLASDSAENQFYFWPGYGHRKGQNAIFVHEIDRPELCSGWFGKWIAGHTDLYAPDSGSNEKPPRRLVDSFETVTDLGVQNVLYRGRIMRRVELFECRNLR